MKALLHIVTAICMLAGSSVSMSAQELVYPPAGLPEETWNIKYMKYYTGSSCDKEYTKYDYERPVTFVWDDATLYIKGLYADYPDSWIKGTRHENELVFENGQLLCEMDNRLEEPSSMYAMNGLICCDEVSTHTLIGTEVRFIINGYADNLWLSSFTLSEDGNAIYSKVVSPLKWYDGIVTTAFWYNTKPEGLYFDDLYDDERGEIGTGYPDVDYPATVMFEKVSGGVDGMTDASDSSEAVTYDLYGRMVDYDNLQPGIYIRNGKKFMVR